MELPNLEPFGLEPPWWQRTPSPAPPSSTTPTIPAPLRANIEGEEGDGFALQALASIRWRKDNATKAGTGGAEASQGATGGAGKGETSQRQEQEDKPAEPKIDDLATSATEKEKSLAPSTIEMNPADPAH